MPQVFGTTIDMLLELGQDAIIGALVLSVLVAALAAGAYLWLRRGKSDVTAVLVGLIVITNLACLTTGAAFVRSRSRSAQSVTTSGGRRETIAAAPRRFGRDTGAWRRADLPRRGRASRGVDGPQEPPPPDL